MKHIFIVLTLLQVGCASDSPEPRRHGNDCQMIDCTTDQEVPINSVDVDTVARTELNKVQIESLDAHNILRKEVNIADLKWSKQLQDVAQDWANKLQQSGCKMQHRPNGKFGENLFWSKGRYALPANVVQSWGDEKHDYNYAKNSCRSGAVCGHYTQIVWAKSTHVGCARSECGSLKEEIWVCNYNPPGNFMGKRPY